MDPSHYFGIKQTLCDWIATCEPHSMFSKSNESTGMIIALVLWDAHVDSIYLFIFPPTVQQMLLFHKMYKINQDFIFHTFFSIFRYPSSKI